MHIWTSSQYAYDLYHQKLEGHYIENFENSELWTLWRMVFEVHESLVVEVTVRKNWPHLP